MRLLCVANKSNGANGTKNNLLLSGNCSKDDAAVARPPFSVLTPYLDSHKRITHPNAAIQPPMLEVFGNDLLQPIMLRVSPEVSVEP